MSHLQPDTLLQNGKYRIIKSLGQGGFGITYLAINSTSGVKVAIKEFFFKDCCERSHAGSAIIVTTAAKKDLVNRLRMKFNKEARTIASMHHENIVNVLDMFEENDTCYYVMNYVDGESLAQYIKTHGALSERDAVKIIKKLAEALEYIHDRHINHLDIKPANVMLDKDSGNIMLIDFGISKHYDAESGEGTTTTPVGISEGYSPVEQYEANGVSRFSPETDIYALGATLYCMVTGEKPPTAIDVLKSGIPSLPANISRATQAAIKTSMQPKIGNRPHSIADFLDILNGKNPGYLGERGNTFFERDTKYVSNDDIKVEVAPEKPEKSEKKKSRVGLIVFIIILILAAAGAAIYFFAFNGSGRYVDYSSDTIAMVQEPALQPEPEPEPVEEGFSTKAFQRKNGENSVYVDMPMTGNPILLQNIREWINEQLGDKYKGDLTDTDAFMATYIDNMPYGNGEFGMEDFIEQNDIRNIYEDSKVVTYTNDHFLYGGGAHGMEGTTGVTFRKSDGKVFTNDMVPFYEIQSYAKDGLKKYFQVSSDEELRNQLFLDDNYSVNSLPTPGLNPWITTDGVRYMYTEYEIGPYSAGTPNFTVPKHVIKSYVNSTGATFFE